MTARRTNADINKYAARAARIAPRDETPGGGDCIAVNRVTDGSATRCQNFERQVTPPVAPVDLHRAVWIPIALRRPDGNPARGLRRRRGQVEAIHRVLGILDWFEFHRVRRGRQDTSHRKVALPHHSRSHLHQFVGQPSCRRTAEGLRRELEAVKSVRGHRKGLGHRNLGVDGDLKFPQPHLVTRQHHWPNGQ